MLSDCILNHPILERSFDTEEEFNNIESILEEEAGITIPAKFTWEDRKPIVTISYNTEAKVFHVVDFEWGNEDIQELYTAVKKEGYDVHFDASVFKAEGVKRGVLGGADVKVPGGWRMLFDEHDPRPLEFANFFNFLKLAKHWRDNKDDWVAAWSFIQYHPMFWSVRNIEKFPHTWDTENGHSSLWVHATTNKEGPVVMIEGGSSVPPHHNHHYHDHKIDVWGKNFEDAYIQFAKNIHRDYSLDGLHREDGE